MDKETLIEQLKANGKLISNEDHAFGYFAAITNIEQSLKGHAIVPEEHNFPRFHLRVQAVIDRLEPPENTAEKAKWSQEEIYLNSLVTRLIPQFKELIYKAMLSSSNKEQNDE